MTLIIPSFYGSAKNEQKTFLYLDICLFNMWNLSMVYMVLAWTLMPSQADYTIVQCTWLSVHELSIQGEKLIWDFKVVTFTMLVLKLLKLIIFTYQTLCVRLPMVHLPWWVKIKDSLCSWEQLSFSSLCSLSLFNWYWNLS